MKTLTPTQAMSVSGGITKEEMQAAIRKLFPETYPNG